MCVIVWNVHMCDVILIPIVIPVFLVPQDSGSYFGCFSL